MYQISTEMTVSAESEATCWVLTARRANWIVRLRRCPEVDAFLGEVVRAGGKRSVIYTRIIKTTRVSVPGSTRTTDRAECVASRLVTRTSRIVLAEAMRAP